MTYYVVLALSVLAFACEVAIVCRQNQLARRRTMRELRRNISRYRV